MRKPKKPKTTQAKAEPATRTLDVSGVGKDAAKIKAIREKFAKALEDPEMRSAMVSYLQGLMREPPKV